MAERYKNLKERQAGTYDAMNVPAQLLTEQSERKRDYGDIWTAAD